MGVGERGCDGGAVIRVIRHQAERLVVLEEREAGLEDVDEVRLHRHDRTEAPEDPEDDLRQLEHEREYRLGRAGCGVAVPDPAAVFGLGFDFVGEDFSDECLDSAEFEAPTDASPAKAGVQSVRWRALFGLVGLDPGLRRERGPEGPLPEAALPLPR